MTNKSLSHYLADLQSEKRQSRSYSLLPWKMTGPSFHVFTLHHRSAVGILMNFSSMRVRHTLQHYHKVASWEPVSCLEELVNSPENATHPSVEVIILDGSVIVNMLRPGSAKTFSDYASQVFLPYVASQLQQANRIGIIWDEYRPDGLKAETRVKRGKGVQRRVEASTPIPGNWQEFCALMKTK